MTERCGDCNGKVEGKFVYELQKGKAPLVCEDCFESYLEKWGVERERREKVKRESRKKLPVQDPLDELE